MSKKLPHGEIFAVPLPDGTYIFGRILLDIFGTLKRRLFPHDSPLTGLGQAYLIEMYSAVRPMPEYVPSPVLIPGAFIGSRELSRYWPTWPTVGEEPVDPRKVEFPEALIGFDHENGSAAFRCGEMQIPVPLTQQGMDFFLPSGVNIGQIYSSRRSVFLWPLTCLIMLGRECDVPRVYEGEAIETLCGLALNSSDLRFSPFREEVYKYLPFRMEQSYFEKQAQLGLHLERLYE